MSATRTAPDACFVSTPGGERSILSTLGPQGRLQLHPRDATLPRWRVCFAAESESERGERLPPCKWVLALNFMSAGQQMQAGPNCVPPLQPQLCQSSRAKRENALGCAP